MQYASQNTAKRTLLPNIICCAICYPYQYAVRHAGRLAAQHNTMPIIWPDKTCCQTEYAVQHHCAQHNILRNKLPDTICCASYYLMNCPTHHAAHHLALHNMLPNRPTEYVVQHATQLDAQHSMHHYAQHNVLPNKLPQPICCFTSCYPTCLPT